MDKNYRDMRNVDISKYTKKRGPANYLPWGACKELLHEHGAEKVYYEPILNDQGHSLFVTKEKYGTGDRTHQCYEVRVKIVIDELEFEQHYPVINGTNPVMDNSLNQLRISTAQARAFVKGVAIHTGLGFELWLDEDDLPDDLSSHSIWQIKKRIEQKLTAKVDKLGGQAALCSALNISAKQLATYLTLAGKLGNFEKMVDQL